MLLAFLPLERPATNSSGLPDRQALGDHTIRRFDLLGPAKPTRALPLPPCEAAVGDQLPDFGLRVLGSLTRLPQGGSSPTRRHPLLGSKPNSSISRWKASAFSRTGSSLWVLDKRDFHGLLSSMSLSTTGFVDPGFKRRREGRLSPATSLSVLPTRLTISGWITRVPSAGGSRALILSRLVETDLGWRDAVGLIS